MIELIWKFPLPNEQSGKLFTVQMPQFSKILNAQWQDGAGMCIWALVPEGHKDRLTERTFAIYGTGHRITDVEGMRKEHVATIQMNAPFNLGTFVWHLFEWKKY